MCNLKGFVSSIVAPSLVVRSDQPGHANESGLGYQPQLGGAQ
jgi:hypothetical protein